MIDISSFLMRWFFLCNLIRDATDIQTYPYLPYSQQQAALHQPLQQQNGGPYQQAQSQNYQPNYEHGHEYQYQQQHHPQQHNNHPQQAAPFPDVSLLNPEKVWKEHCLRGIYSYPPGTQRLLVVDAMRQELVDSLCQYLRHVDLNMQRIKLAIRPGQAENSEPICAINGSSFSDSSNDPYWDSDTEIVRKFERGIASGEEEAQVNLTRGNAQQATLSISRNGATVNGQLHYSDLPEGTLEQSKQALQDIREYLPQLVSAVLKSPPPFDANLVDPVQKLRDLVIDRCHEDPSWGIELCWLLEAEVGRAWKNLFEHRQQTGRRLIIVLPADKAAVLAKIGTEKREAFDLLQDAERTTAYGYAAVDGAVPDSGKNGARLPSSLSLLRCSHFGDTMHFIDRLTKISLDLRMVPTIERHAYLHDSLYEMNRRLRRRMVTRGEVSLDVEDNLGPYDWPQVNELTTDMLRYSVHFPLMPCHGNWPSSGFGMHNESDFRGGVMQVLNIVVPESRILASRERCPYLVRLEVADTGLEGNDARLYAVGPSGAGATVEEALHMNGASDANPGSEQNFHQQPCDVPPELFLETNGLSGNSSGSSSSLNTEGFPRGGWQVHANGTDFVHESPYDMARQQQYEQLHQQMQEAPVAPQPQNQLMERPSVTTGLTLLNRIFGQPWAEVCDEVRRTSPFGHLDGWRLASFILKAGEDIRREALVMQIISKLRGWFEAEIPESDRPYLRPYTIMCVGGDAGLIECLTDAKSIDELKKKVDGFESLRDYFERAYGPPQNLTQSQSGQPMASVPPYQQRTLNGLPTFEQAQENFLRSLVGYSLVCYILQIKDRHNANILIDREGRIAHIDYGFVLGDTPKMGKVPLFSERAPFKLSAEFWEVLGGWRIKQRGLGVRFCKMFEQAFAVASAHRDEIASLVEGAMLTLTDDPKAASICASRVRSRLEMSGAPNSQQQRLFIIDLVNAALTSWGTSTYDWLQKNMNGYQ